MPQEAGRSCRALLSGVVLEPFLILVLLAKIFDLVATVSAILPSR